MVRSMAWRGVRARACGGHSCSPGAAVTELHGQRQHASDNGLLLLWLLGRHVSLLQAPAAYGRDSKRACSRCVSAG